MQDTKLRPLMKSSPVKPTILYTPTKSNGPAFIESYTEMVCAMWLDQHPQIAHFESQPASFEYCMDGKTRRYTPDFHSIDINGESSYIEVKSKSYVASEKDLEKFRFLRESFDRIGIGFKVMQIDLFEQTSKNLMFLDRYKSHDPLLIKKRFSSFKGDLNQLINKGVDDTELSSLYAAMARGQVKYSRNVKIGPKMEVSW